MIPPETVELSATEASQRIWQELQQAQNALQSDDLETALDRFVRAMGLALQLGPAASERVLAETVAAARVMTRQQNANALSALGPTLVGLTNQVREAGALPDTAVMEAWAAVAIGLGKLYSQLGLALAIAPSRRSGMIADASTRALLLDDATGNLFGLTIWLNELALELEEERPSKSQLA